MSGQTSAPTLVWRRVTEGRYVADHAGLRFVVISKTSQSKLLQVCKSRCCRSVH